MCYIIDQRIADMLYNNFKNNYLNDLRKLVKYIKIIMYYY